MHEIIIQQNLFLNEVKIVPVFGIMEHDKQQVSDILGKSLYFTGMELIRKTKTEGKYLLVTTKRRLYCAQRHQTIFLSKMQDSI